METRIFGVILFDKYIMAIYRFRVSFEDYDDVVRIIDIKSSQTFIDFHQIIHKSNGYDVEKSSSFYISTDHWIKGDEIAYLPTQRKIDRGVILMENSQLKNFIEDPHQKFYYTYNFDRPFDFHVELTQIILEENPAIDYPAIVKSVGEAPKIFQNNTSIPAQESEKENDEFDFLNEMNFEPSSSSEIEALNDMGVNTSDEGGSENEESDEFSDEFSDNENYEDDDNNY